jgi:hypothetical protein
MSIFDTATVIPAPKKATKAESRASFQVEGLSELAAINAMIGTLEGLKEQFEAQVKDGSLAIYTAEAMRYGKKPESFNLVDDKATGQYQLRKRSSASALADEEIALLEALSIPTEANVKVAERFVFNPELTQAQLEAISKAVTKEKALAGVSVVLKQAEVKTTIVSDGAIEAACKNIKTKDQLVAVLKVIGVSALKTMFDSQEMKDALKVLEGAGIKLVPDAAPAAKGKKAKAS